MSDLRQQSSEQSYAPKSFDARDRSEAKHRLPEAMTAAELHTTPRECHSLDAPKYGSIVLYQSQKTTWITNGFVVMA
jgi:hypothetical protein